MSNNTNYRNRNNSKRNTKKDDAMNRDERAAMNEKEDRSSYRKDSYRKGSKTRPSGRSTPNDARWYTKNAQLALDAGRLSFNVPTGSVVLLDKPAPITNINGITKETYKLPGVMELRFVPTYGLANFAEDPLNVSARNIYSNVRFKNSGAKNYDPTDLMLYLMAMDNIYMYYQRMCRIYGVARVFSQLNRHLPETLSQALRFDYNDIVANLSNFRTYINTVSAKIGTLCVPATFPLFERHMWMCSGVYADAPTPKAQFYVFNPAVVGVYNEKTSSAGGFLQVRIITGDDTFAKMRTTMDALLGAVIASEDCGIMSGDIRKAYSDSGLFTVSQISDDYTTLPLYSEEVLRQIQNATILAGVDYTNGAMITQDINNNILISGATFGGLNSYMYAGNKILTGSDAQPSPEEVLVNTRLMVMGTVSEGTPSGTPSPSNPVPLVLTPTALGTEAIVGSTVYGVLQNGVGALTKYSLISHEISKDNASGTLIQSADLERLQWMNAYSLYETFNYHPNLSISEGIFNSNGKLATESVHMFHDVDNYTVISAPVLYNLHQTALLSLFGIDQ